MNAQFLSSIILALALLAIGVTTTAHSAHAKPNASEIEGGHTWKFTYFANSGSAEIEVILGLFNVETGEVVQEDGRFTYNVSCSHSGASATCDLDIRGAIEQSYDNMGYKVPLLSAYEFYKGIDAQATGVWTNPDVSKRDTLFEHPSLIYALAANKGVANYTTAWSYNSFDSGPFKPEPNVDTAMIAKFSTPYDPKNREPSVFEHILRVNNRDTLLKDETLNRQRISFKIAPERVLITQMPGFQMDKFVVDPLGRGHGGG